MPPTPTERGFRVIPQYQFLLEFGLGWCLQIINL